MFFNFLNENAIHVRAQRLVGRLHGPAGARMARLIAGALREDPRNARTPTAREIARAPDWAQRAISEGRTLWVFAASPSSVARMRRIVWRTADALRELEADARGLQGLELVQHQECMRLLDNIGHMNLEDIDHKTRVIRRRRRVILTERARSAASRVVHCERIFIAAGPGLRWRRLATTGELGESGKNMRNCTAYDRGTHARYARALETGEAEYWVLEALEDPRPTMMVMIGLPHRALLDARTERNGFPPARSPELAVLVRERVARMRTGFMPEVPLPCGGAALLGRSAALRETEISPRAQDARTDENGANS